MRPVSYTHLDVYKRQASVDEIADTHACLKRRMKAYLGQELPILYGGSVNEKNAQQIGKIVEVDGFCLLYTSRCV